MTAIRYPVAQNAEAAFSAPMARAARASEAEALAGAAVEFVSEAAGPAFESREAALSAYAGRLDDERLGRRVSIEPEDRYCALIEMAASPVAPRAAMKPVYEDGRRWPKPSGAATPTVWRLSIRYWRVSVAQPVLEAEPPASPRAERKTATVDAKALRERLGEPLRPLKPQQPLDIGLFEVRPPEAPHILMPDE
ncbi:MAG TPA: hypothetical protein VE309_06505 [Caulobacteraceae bacterium]|jgi:hypothetical protein|nr:hypothetical protein [Caulobacteraceae bacterium]